MKATKTLARLFTVCVRLGLLFLGGAIAFLAAAARTTPANDPLGSSIRGGELNLRTGQFDDGTDPDGFYDFE